MSKFTLFVNASVKLLALLVCLLFTNTLLCAEDFLALDKVKALTLDMEKNLEKNRAAFLRTEKIIWRMDGLELLDALKALDDYPLVPYLLARKLRDNFSLSDLPQIRAFLNEYDASPLVKNLRRDWLYYLSRRQRADLFIEFYRPTNDVELKCNFIEFQIEKGVPLVSFYSQIADLWTVGKSQPKQCDKVFKEWIKASQLTEDLVLLRIKKAADGGSHTLIPYLKGLLPESKQYLADLWRNTRKDPSYIHQISRFPGKYPLIEAEVMSYGLSRLIWRDQALAIRTMNKAQERLTFSREQLAMIYGRFAIKLAIDDHQDAETWLMKASEIGDDPEVMRWHLAYLLKQQNWQKIALLIEKSRPQYVSDYTYRYWLARSYEKLARSEQAQQLYQQLAEERHYYGFLASARISKPYRLQNKPMQVSTNDIDYIFSKQATQRAYELKQLERFHEARLEWRSMQGELNDTQNLASTLLSSEWGWHDQSIFTFSREGYLDDVFRRFPTAYSDDILREAKRNQIEPEWAFAIARRESSFMPDAQSSANAKGLMQLLPSTARYLERKRVTTSQLLDASTNVKLGNKYLRYLLDKVNGNSLLATASYNAGWRRVMQWLPEENAMEADVWVEIIPYKETRNYVKAVMAYKQIYKAQLDNSTLNDENHAGIFIDMLNAPVPKSL